jgi:tetratricopeptide (TPR) repeat protein
VQQAGDRVRIYVRLIDALPEEQNLWGQTYERAMSEVLVMYGEMARAIAEKAQINLTADELTRLTSARQVNPEAYEAYIQGRLHWYKLTPQDLEIALQYFESALRIDPNYALAHTGVALVWLGRNQSRLAPRNEAIASGKEAAEKALELDSELAEAHYALAGIKAWAEWDWQGAEKAFQRAIELDPNFPDARAYASHFLSIMGHTDEALPHIERALELDPFNALFHGLYAIALQYQRRFDDSITARKPLWPCRPTRESPGPHFSTHIFRLGCVTSNWPCSGRESHSIPNVWLPSSVVLKKADTQGLSVTWRTFWQLAMKRQAGDPLALPFGIVTPVITK